MTRSSRRGGGLAGKILSRRPAFRTEYVDLDRGIRMGHLEPEERITQIFKALLLERHGVRVICDRWGRGVYWQWICWVPEPNRKAKPMSSAYNFGSAKFFVAVDQEERVFQAGMQIERAPLKPEEDDWPVKLEKDWDWNVLVAALRDDPLPRRLKRLLREGFHLRVGPFAELCEFDRKSYDLKAVRNVIRRMPRREWGGLQLYWPTPEAELKKISGPDLIDAVMAVFDEVAPAMNVCMYAPCLKV